MAARRVHPALSNKVVAKYAADVKSGKVVAGRLVKLAVKRFYADIKNGKKRGLEFRADMGQHTIDFYHKCLQHSKGVWAGQPFILSPWQQFITWNLFGWFKNGLRRFRVSYEEVARKNGKSTFLAGRGLYLLDQDDEPGAEVYAVATKKDQAKIVHGEAERMVRKSPALKQRITIFRNNLHIKNTASKFEPLGQDSDTEDGLNIHGAMIDELHAHKTREMWDIIDTATGARLQPLISAITTAGHDKLGICYEQRDYGIKILEGIIDDDSFFVYIATIDIKQKGEKGKSDDWRDEKCWLKANPNLGVSKNIEDMRRKAKKAKEVAAAQNAFKNKELNVWTEQHTLWIDATAWNRCKGDVPDYDLGHCFAGLDLGSNRDLSAFVRLFPHEDKCVVRSDFWMPEDGVHDRVKKDRVPYDLWIEQGFIQTTPGNITDYDFIREAILQRSTEHEIKELAFDRWGASQLSIQLANEDITMVPFGQGYHSMAAPTKELERLVLAALLLHGGNPVLRWMMSNVTVRLDPAGNMKPDKEKSSEKIDGIVALIMALGRLIVHQTTEDVYSDRGVLVV